MYLDANNNKVPYPSSLVRILKMMALVDAETASLIEPGKETNIFDTDLTDFNTD